jgi:acetyl-CoA carboxylase biotin carboxyl carrier protein
MIDIRKLKELVRLMVSNDLTEVDLRDTEEQVTLRRSSAHAHPHIVTHAVSLPPPAAGSAHAPAPSQLASSDGGAAVAAAPAAVTEEAGFIRIESPMVGTFYSSPNPDSPPFADTGSRVTPDTVVCIIEAMKIFNEIKAECAGTVQRVLVKSGEAVEFGQPLFLVKPD